MYDDLILSRVLNVVMDLEKEYAANPYNLISVEDVSYRLGLDTGFTWQCLQYLRTKGLINKCTWNTTYSSTGEV